MRLENPFHRTAPEVPDRVSVLYGRSESHFRTVQKGGRTRFRTGRWAELSSLVEVTENQVEVIYEI